MGKEIERKFLLAGTSIPIPRKHKKIRIKQAYISVEKNKQVRVRLSKFSPKHKLAEICVKYTSELVRDEFEFQVAPIAYKEAKQLYKKCDMSVEKHRLSFKANKVKYDVDTFPNNIQYVEVEFKSIENMEEWLADKPMWIGEEISNKDEYSNITFAKQNLKF